MNEPIISPWIFYWMDVLTSIKNFPQHLVLGALILFLIFVVVVVMTLMGEGNDEVDAKMARVLSVAKRITIGYLTVFAFFTVVSTFIPNQETMYKMLITSQVTPNNVEYLKNEVKATGQGLVDSITDASIKIIKAKESK